MARRLDPSEDELHLLYLDWCSTQVARRFIELSHDEVWFRARLAASASNEPLPDPSPNDPPILADRIPGYLDLVRRTALLLAEEMKLPTFPEWSARYSGNPNAYQIERLGH